MREGGSAWRKVVGAALLILLVSSLPYLIAWAATPEQAHFTGILLNPLDGHSYLAKMRQGADGHLRFRLAFTPEEQRGAYLFVAHLLLGHLSRWLGLPLIVTYHVARLLAGLCLLLVAYSFTRFVGGASAPFAAWLLLAVASGLGWLVALTGYLTSDLLVPEAFVFPAILDTFHFPLAIALMLVVLMTLARPGGPDRWGLLQAAGAALFLGVLQPFGVIPVYGTLALWLAFRWGRDRRLDRGAVWKVAGTGLLAVLYPLYGLAAIRADPVLAGWSAQNQTPSPPPWDWLLAGGVLTVLALPGMARAARRRSDGDLLLLAWVLAAGVGMYVPLALQRRLSLGLEVPLALLAAQGWQRSLLPRIRARRRGPATAALLGFAALGNLFLMLTLVLGAFSGEPRFYLSDGEWEALRFLRREVSHEAVVLCSPRMGMFVPAWAGQAVVYGHPFETVDAPRRRAQVEAFFAGRMSPTEQAAFLRENRVRYLLRGPRERRLGGARPEGELLFSSQGVEVWAVRR